MMKLNQRNILGRKVTLNRIVILHHIGRDHLRLHRKLAKLQEKIVARRRKVVALIDQNQTEDVEGDLEVFLKVIVPVMNLRHHVVVKTAVTASVQVTKGERTAEEGALIKNQRNPGVVKDHLMTIIRRKSHEKKNKTKEQQSSKKKALRWRFWKRKRKHCK